MLRLADLAWQRGEAVPPELALPVYVRDQVALTTLERAAVKAASA
jgi:tRNA threonylcarbamoyladenosine biosynthesis protein TsaB